MDRKIGHKVFYFKSITSTNDFAKGWLDKNKDTPEGVAFVADTQTKGRGRLSRKWESPPSMNIYASLILKPHIKSKNLPLLTFPISLAVLETCQSEVEGLRLKWPNDVMLQSKKVAGILLESEPHGVVVGLGINVNQKSFSGELSHIATSLANAKGSDIDREKLLTTLFEKIEKWYTYFLNKGFSHVKEIWLQKSGLKGLHVQLQDGTHVVLLDLNDDGSLLFEGENKKKGKIYTGEEICSWPSI